MILKETGLLTPTQGRGNSVDGDVGSSPKLRSDLVPAT